MKTLQIAISACFLSIILLLSFNAELLSAQSTSSDNIIDSDSTLVEKPIIFFETPNFDFGKAYKGDKVEHVYKFKNRGKSTLEIKKVKPSCGCTAAVLSNNTVLPGETGEIKTTFNTVSYEGRVKKTISVLSNDPNTSNHKLTISGEVIEEISFKPKNINFGSFRADDQTDKIVKVSVKSQSGPDFKIVKATSSKPYVSVDTSTTEDQKGEYTITATLKNHHEVGRFSGKVFLESNSTKQPKTSIIFYGVVEGDITINQRRIYYGTIPEGREITKKLYVKINESYLRILSSKISPDYLSVHIDEKYEQKNPYCLIETKLHKDAPVGRISGQLELTTNSEEQPIINIPITGEVHKADKPE